MPQTLLALLSMVLTTMFAVNQHRTVLTSRMNMVNQDLSLRGTGVATDLLEEIGAMAFDEATKTNAITDDDALTAISSEDVEYYLENLEIYQEAGGVDDIDDFHGRLIERTRQQENHEFHFKARPRVRYVTPDGQYEVNYPTKFKKVTLAVVSTEYAFADTIFVSQVYSCGSRCDW